MIEIVPGYELSLNQIKAKITSDIARKAIFRERLDIMDDKMRGIITNELSRMFSPETFDDMKHYVAADNNVAKRICREVSMVYKDDPTRKVTPKGNDKRFQEIVQQMRLNPKMQKVNYYLNGLNDLILLPAVSGNTLDLNIFTPDRVTVFEDVDNPTKINALAIEDWYWDKDGKKHTVYYFWSPTRHFVLDEQFRIEKVIGNEEMLNPYWQHNRVFEGDQLKQDFFYPFVFAHNTERTHSFWDESSGNELFEATKNLAIKKTFTYFMFPMQFKQMAVKNQTIDTGAQSLKNPQIKSPLHVLQTNGDTTVLDWQSQLDQLKNAIESDLYQIGSNYGVSAENFKLTATATSGFARMIAKERLLEIRAEQVKNYRNIEQEIFKTITLANNIYSLGETISESGKFVIDFKEPEFPNDPMSELSVMEKEMTLGLTNILEVIKKKNPDIKTDEEAMVILEKNLEVRDQVQSKFSALTRELSSFGKAGEKDNA